ncbi:hypothetical protein PMI31_01421 [Pseudomonas sp. GM55]|nr:hypothetical protein PMI31_01421 [Pseudomonas sp. GM55]
MAAPREETHQYGQKLSGHTNSGTDPKLLARLHKGLGTIRQKKAPLGSGAYVGASLLAMVVNDYAYLLVTRGALEFIASERAPTFFQASCACALNGLSGNSGAWGSALTDLRHAPSHSA